MQRYVRVALLSAFVLALLPVLASADAPDPSPMLAAPAPAPTADESPEVSTDELAELLGIEEPQEMTCTQSNNCVGCTIPYFACTCQCDVEMAECEAACGSDPMCQFECEQEGQFCHNCCAGH